MKIKTSMAIAAAVAALASTAGAETLEKLTFAEAVDAADIAVVGKVTGSSIVESDGQVYTVTEFDTQDTVFGQVGGTFSVRFPGGRLQNTLVPMGEVVAGSPSFFVNSEALLLLDQSADGLNVVGYNQGIFPVVTGKVALPNDKGGMVSLDKAKSAVAREKADK
ncbi:hypothetical protein [Parvularcula maris]|uniref:PRC-barrel domain-containing protein n=1 Tax=Parvularcula maris TaxID=2965077 RepID=A0A9X2RHP1_9PROT|nr:hypothetical protein [Parvularcula maris]MCQ8184141.1 hypothetical protein [Parvularcula maris]